METSFIQFYYFDICSALLNSSTTHNIYKQMHFWDGHQQNVVNGFCITNSLFSVVTFDEWIVRNLQSVTTRTDLLFVSN